MHLSLSTSNIVLALEKLSGKKLNCREDLGMLLDLSREWGAGDDLEELSFQAKFAVRAFGIMKRIGRDGEGYDRLAAEFSASLERVRTRVHGLLHGAAPDVRARLSLTYLAMTPESLDRLLALLSDLSWYKNWRIDHPGESAWEIKPE